MAYYFIHNSEDGITIQSFATHTSALDEIHELTGEDVVPAYRAEFIDYVPNEYTDTNYYLIINGEAVMPSPIETVRRYVL